MRSTHPEYSLYALLRAGAVIAALGWILFHPEPTIRLRLLPMISLFSVYSAGLYLLIRRKPRQVNRLFALATVIDLLSITAFIYWTGGRSDSLFYLAYILVIATRSVQFGLRGGLQTAVAAIFLFVAVTLSSQNYWGDFFLQALMLGATAAMAGYLADDMRRTRLELERRADELTALTEVTRTVNSSIELPQVLPAVLELATTVMKVEACAVHILDDQGLLQAVASRGFSAIEQEHLPVEECFMGKAIRTGSPILYYQDQQAGDACEPLFRSEGMVCALSAPLSSGSRMMGTLTVFAAEPNVFADDEIELICVLAAQVGNAIENATLYKKQKDLYLAVVQAFVAAIDAKDSYTRGHSEFVHRYAWRIAERMKVDGDQLERIATAALLHDIGKIGVNSNILRKPGALNDEEYAEIKMHVTIGEQIINQVADFRDLAPIVAAHHEWYNGKGYPEGLAGEGIPLGARIIAVADAYEAMTANRVYRRALPKERALAEITRCSGVQFDPAVVEVFLQLVHEGKLDEPIDGIER
ncbi:HD domain-containing protein [Heliobacterium gestii]|uniref:HD domain-containing protein n=1 Tax=Heliomicrobium gestii TaxID=2699 RepID=A0A845LA52_HELGE|nr:HD domain-containing phosphohydrolase [Heliomicrobium gestii]MBM7865146.1 HD-GYP domain-containing protein (c-di-GMP phosphodiesterase class II) [Heliomicrobium gestii]MZP41415.1 HD domain-containing protein [Heliomicrobium gestii]